MWLRLRGSYLHDEAQVLPVQTRRRCAEKEKGDWQEVVGTETPINPPQSLSTEKKKRSIFKSRTASEQVRIQRMTSWSWALIYRDGIRGMHLNHLAEPKPFYRIFGWWNGRHSTQKGHDVDQHGKQFIMRKRNGPQNINYWKKDYTLKKNCVCRICSQSR